MTHQNDGTVADDADVRQVRLALTKDDHRRLRILAAETDRTYSEVVSMGLAALLQQRGTP